MPILIIDGTRYVLPATQKAIRLLADDGTTELFSLESKAGDVVVGGVLSITGALSAPTLVAATSIKSALLDGVAPTGAGLTIGALATAKLGFYGHAVVAQQAAVAVDAAGIHAALVALGLITA